MPTLHPACRRWRQDSGPRNLIRDETDPGARISIVTNHLAAIRTAFDKFCRRDVTLGLATPRRPKRLPVILSVEEVIAILEVAPSLRDKLVLGLMYATGMRVGEVVRVRWRDVDFDRNTINVWQGKGRSDRQDRNSPGSAAQAAVLRPPTPFSIASPAFSALPLCAPRYVRVVRRPFRH